jgi:protein-disulfide isomerase
MTQEAKVLLGIGIATVIILIGGVFYLSGTNPQVTSQGSVEKKILVAGKNTTGPKSAKVTVVEFADFQCPACAAFHPEMKKILSDYNGKIYFVYRHFPLPMHKNARGAAQAAEAAAAQGKFWPMYDQLFEKQSEWSEVANPTDLFASYAKNVKLDEEKFKKAVEESNGTATIQKGIDDGNKAGVNSTPTLFVNGKKVEGANSIADLATQVRSAIDTQLQSAK